MMTATSMIWLYSYVALGALVFLLLGYALDSEPLPGGWWRDRSFVMVALLCVVCWPLVLWLWVRKNGR